MLHLYFTKYVVWGDGNDYQLANWSQKSQRNKAKLKRVYASTNIYFSWLASMPPQQESTLLSRWTGMFLTTSGITFKHYQASWNIIKDHQALLSITEHHWESLSILDGSPQMTEANLRTLLCPKFCYWWGSWTIQLGSCLPRWNTVGSPPWLWKVSLNFISIYHSRTVLESSEQAADSKTVPGFDNWPKFGRVIQQFW